MKKTDLILNLSDHSRLSKVDAKASVEVILEALTKGIVSGEGVEIRGFGGFYKKYRKARLGINPKTSERTQVKEKFVPFFKPGKSLRKSVNKD
ncbi:HU family DNA-binding protein [Candidatus Thioglobus sp.]|jgi:Bacterial nucleoid DNA-binding protein|uniref:HU family DNA-binding protein n=1 Tax=Candidatus Thioglobus sp. TaxID=2026721 RepID=UPI003242C52B